MKLIAICVGLLVLVGCSTCKPEPKLVQPVDIQKEPTPVIKISVFSF